VSLIGKGTCAVVEDMAFYLEREFGNAPKSIANAFVDVWKQTPVVRLLSHSEFLILYVG